MRRASTLTRELRRLDLAGKALSGVQREAAGLIAEHVGADACSLITLDPATLITTRCDLWGAAHDPAYDAAFGRLEHVSDGDFLLIDQLLRRSAPVGRLVDESGGDPDRSPRYRTMLGPLGVKDELRCALVARGACWGFVGAYRLGGCFAASDARFVLAHAPALAELLRRSMLRALLALPSADPRPPGLVRLGSAGRIEALTPEAEQWIALGGERLDQALRRLLAISAGSRPLDVLVTGPDGLALQVHATTLDDRPAAIVEQPRPIAVARRIVSAWGLTPRERELTGLVAQGRTTEEIAAALGISGYTVQDHLKAVFDKAGVSSRRALVAALFFDHALPEIARATPPSPYGWFVETKH